MEIAELPLIATLKRNDSVLALALGGSRSRNLDTENSDYDVFCVICDETFEEFHRGFSRYLESIPSIRYATEAYYLENWGYLYKAIDDCDRLYDVAINSESRMGEMGIRTTNVIFKDVNGSYRKHVDGANDESLEVRVLETNRFYDYATHFGFESLRFREALHDGDYWYCVWALEKMRTLLIRCNRVDQGAFARIQSCPERDYEEVNHTLQQLFILDGTYEGLRSTFMRMCTLFDEVVSDPEARRRSRLL